MRGGNEPEEQAEGRRDFMGGRFRNRRRGISTGREELTAWQRGGCDQGWIQGVSTPEREVKD